MSSHAIPYSEQNQCPECHSQLTIKSGTSGAFWGCSNYPKCEYVRPLSNQIREVQIVKTLDDVCCPECEGGLAVKSGKYGLFIGCLNYPDCSFTVKEDDDDEYIPVACPICEKGELHRRSSKKGKPFYSCNQYPKCEYVLNHKPVSMSCPNCHWPLLMENDSEHLGCPQPQCDYTQAKKEQ